MKPEKENSQYFSDILKNGLVKLIPALGRLFFSFQVNSEKTREQVREIFQTASGQVREKAEETRQAVKLRMAIMEIEHHLNRLYPQIGKLVCDLAEGKKDPLKNPEIKSKIELAEEYRERLKELRAEPIESTESTEPEKE